MPKISQPTLALMIMLFRGLTRRPDDVTAPLVRDLDMEMMEWDVMPHDIRRQFGGEGWDFQQTLSELHAGRLRDAYALEVPEFDTEDGRSRLLEKMAEYLCRKIDLIKWDVRGKPRGRSCCAIWKWTVTSIEMVGCSTVTVRL